MNSIFFIECNYGRLGNAFRETDRDSNSREEVVRLIATGECTPIKVLEVCEDEGWVRDITASVLEEVAQRFVDVGSSFDRQAQVWDHARKHREGMV